MSRLMTVAVCLCLLWAMSCERDGLDGMLASSDNLGSYDVFYYIGPDSCVMEVWTLTSWPPPDSDESLDPDSGWTEVTLAKLDSLGIMAPSMAEAQAALDGYVSEGETDGNKYLSYLNCNIIHGKKHVMAGSRTERPWYSPGWVRAHCTFRRNHSAYASAPTDYLWAWRVYAQPRPSITDLGNAWYYQAFGLHKYNRAPGWQYSSYVERVF